MKHYEAVGVGVVIGIVYGVILWAATDSLSLASWMLYKNSYIIPVVTALVSALILLAGVLSYTRWVNGAENAIVRLAEAMQMDWQNQMDKEDDEDEIL